jgi:hypothetical protein
LNKICIIARKVTSGTQRAKYIQVKERMDGVDQFEEGKEQASSDDDDLTTSVKYYIIFFFSSL